MAFEDDPVANVAIAMDVPPETVRADTPLQSIGWQGTAQQWVMVSDRLGSPLQVDPPADFHPKTIEDLISGLRQISTRNESAAVATATSTSASTPVSES